MKLQVLVKLVMNYLLLAPFAQAADRSGNYMVLGQGTISCGRWISDRSRDDAWAEEAWLLGYLTAYNRNDWPGTNVASGTDSDGSFAWIDNYCRAAPLDDMATAAFRLAGFLASRGSQSTTLRQRYLK